MKQNTDYLPPEQPLRRKEIQKLLIHEVESILNENKRPYLEHHTIFEKISERHGQELKIHLQSNSIIELIQHSRKLDVHPIMDGGRLLITVTYSFFFQFHTNIYGIK